MSDRRPAARRVRRFLAPIGERLGTIGKYRIIREIARGGMATVYEAEDPELRRRIALKVLHDADDRQVLLSRFQREAAIAARLRHPHIVAIHEVGLAGRGGTHYIAMDLIEGETLATLLRRRSLSPDRLLRWFEEIAQAVAYAHENGVTHRDIKPANILIASSGRALLTDFGLARGSGASMDLTGSEAVLGTLGYMAPEQVSGRSREVDARSDVYALGIVLYEILAGRRPFEARTLTGQCDSIRERDPAAPSLLRRSVPRDLDAICLKAMDRNPGRRYPSARGLAEDIARYRRGDPVTARPLPLPLRAWRRLVRRRAIAIPIGIGLAVTSLFAGWFLRTRSDLERIEAERALRAHAKLRLEREALHEIEEARACLEQTWIPLAGKRRRSPPASTLRQALSFLKSAARKAPHLAAARLHLGRVYALQGNPDRALKEFDEAIALEPSLGRAYLERGQIRSKRREWKAAFDDFSSALRINPLTAEARIGRARVSEAQGKPAAALADADELVRTHPSSPTSYLLRAQLLERMGRIEEAVGDCSRMIALDPHPIALAHRGRLHQRLGRTDEARADFEAALETAPHNWRARRAIARALRRLKEGRPETGGGLRLPSLLAPRD